MQSGCPAVVGDGHNVAYAAVDLQCLRRSSATLFKQPPVKSKLQENFGVVFFVNVPSHLGIANDVAVAFENQEIWSPDNLGLASPKRLPYKKRRLIQNGNPVFDGFRGLCSPCSSSSWPKSRYAPNEARCSRSCLSPSLLRTSSKTLATRAGSFRCLSHTRSSHGLGR